MADDETKLREENHRHGNAPCEGDKVDARAFKALIKAAVAENADS